MDLATPPPEVLLQLEQQQPLQQGRDNAGDREEGTAQGREEGGEGEGEGGGESRPEWQELVQDNGGAPQPMELEVEFVSLYVCITMCMCVSPCVCVMYALGGGIPLRVYVCLQGLWE